MNHLIKGVYRFVTTVMALPSKHQIHLRLSIFSFWVVAAFCFLFILTFPFGNRLLPSVSSVLHPLFSPLIQIAGKIIGLNNAVDTSLASDSLGLYLHCCVLASISVLAGIVLMAKQPSQKLRYGIHVVAAYYLAYVLLCYGLNKLFKWQFYLPEPNTLFTTIGEIPPDLLFWSAMGSSYPYTVFSGMIEVLPALLLFFRRTRLLGGLIALGVLVNVAAINVGFNISVKLFTGFLLLLTLVVLSPYTSLLKGLLLNHAAPTHSFTPPDFNHKFKIYVLVKTVVIGWLFADMMIQYISSGNYNDDKAQRPALHGAYSVETLVKNGDTLPPLLTDSFYIKRVFVHRKGFFIIQKMKNAMQDYKLRYGPQELHLHNYYTDTPAGFFTVLQTGDNTLHLYGLFEGDTLAVSLKKYNTGNLPLLNPRFDWVEGSID